MAQTNRQKLQGSIQKLVVLAILAAIIVLLQSFAGVIKIGPFNITLSLVPIMIGAILYGPWAGTFLGTVFGAVVAWSVVTGVDAGGNLMFQQLPFLTVFLCVFKSALAGFLAGLIARLFARKHLYFGVALSAVVCPVVNTGVLTGGMLLFYRNLVNGWALAEGYENAFLYILFGMVGLNFLVEMAINLVLIPGIVSIIRALKKSGVMIHSEIV